MQYIRPSYYDKFKCIGAKCPDTCCSGWQIMIDEETLCHYRKMQGSLGESIREGIDEEQSCFLQNEKGDCHFLRRDGLCQIFWTSQKEEDWCDTCRTYPRHIEEFEDVREISLGMSCPEAARIIFSQTEPLCLLTEEDEEYEEYEDFDYLLYSKLLDVRELLLKQLQDRSKPMERRFALAKEKIHACQRAIDENRIFEMDQILENWEKALLGNNEKAILSSYNAEAGQNPDGKEERLSWEERYAERKGFFSYLEEFELLRESWQLLRDEAYERLYQDGIERYIEKAEAFYRRGYAGGRDSWELAIEEIAVYFVFVYLCGAVYDDRLLEKYEMAEFSAKCIEELCIAEMLKKGSTADQGDLIKISSGFCRELEHSDENLNLLEDLLYEANKE